MNKPGNELTDTELLDWLGELEGVNLVSDDRGHWAVSSAGWQDVPVEVPADIQVTSIVTKDEWKKTIREALIAGYEEWHSDA